MGSLLMYVCQTYLELYSEKGGGDCTAKNSAYIYAFCMCAIDYRPYDRKYTTSMC